MSYIRVIPRDLFNEANLLKCYGKLYINLDHLNAPGAALVHYGRQFNVEQNESDGSLSIQNVRLEMRGEHVALMRPLNSREEWPLYAEVGRDEWVSVFDDAGNFTTEMLDFLAPSGEAE